MGILLIIVYPIYFLLIYHNKGKIYKYQYIKKHQRFNASKISRWRKDSTHLIYQNDEKIHTIKYIMR